MQWFLGERDMDITEHGTRSQWVDVTLMWLVPASWNLNLSPPIGPELVLRGWHQISIRISWCKLEYAANCTRKAAMVFRHRYLGDDQGYLSWTCLPSVWTILFCFMASAYEKATDKVGLPPNSQCSLWMTFGDQFNLGWLGREGGRRRIIVQTWE